MGGEYSVTGVSKQKPDDLWDAVRGSMSISSQGRPLPPQSLIWEIPVVNLFSLLAWGGGEG